MDDIPFIHEDRPESYGEDGERSELLLYLPAYFGAGPELCACASPDGPADSEPSTSPFISSLSLAGSEENLGKRLLRRLSE